MLIEFTCILDEVLTFNEIIKIQTWRKDTEIGGQLLRSCYGGRKKDVSQRKKSKLINFSGIPADPLLKMVANDPPEIIASMSALLLGPKALLAQKTRNIFSIMLIADKSD